MLSGGLNFERVVDEVRDRAFEQGHASVDDGRLVLRDDDRPAGAPLLAGRDPVDEVAQVDGLHGLLGTGVGRELDQLAHELGELSQLDVGRVEELPPLLGVERVGPAQHVDVGAQRGERRAQLVARVHHQPPLLLAGRPQRVEHAVEAGREPSDLVAPGDGDRMVEVVRARHERRALRQVLDRPHHATSDEPRERRRDEGARERDEEQARVERREQVVVGVDSPRDLRGASTRKRDRQDAERVLPDPDVAESRPAAVLCDRPVGGVDRKFGLAADVRLDRSGGREDLRERVGIGERRPFALADRRRCVADRTGGRPAARA